MRLIRRLLDLHRGYHRVDGTFMVAPFSAGLVAQGGCTFMEYLSHFGLDLPLPLTSIVRFCDNRAGDKWQLRSHEVAAPKSPSKSWFDSIPNKPPIERFCKS